MRNRPAQFFMRGQTFRSSPIPENLRHVPRCRSPDLGCPGHGRRRPGVNHAPVVPQGERRGSHAVPPGAAQRRARRISGTAESHRHKSVRTRHRDRQWTRSAAGLDPLHRRSYVFVFRQENAPAFLGQSPLTASTISWQQAGLLFVVVADVPPGDLAQLRNAFERH